MDRKLVKVPEYIEVTFGLASDVKPEEVKVDDKSFKDIAPDADGIIRYKTGAGIRERKDLTFTEYEVPILVKVKVITPDHRNRPRGVEIYSEEEKLKTATQWAYSVLSQSIWPGKFPCNGPENCRYKDGKGHYMSGPTVKIDGTRFIEAKVVKPE